MSVHDLFAVCSLLSMGLVLLACVAYAFGVAIIECIRGR